MNSVVDAQVGRTLTIAVNVCNTGVITLKGEVVANCAPFGFGVRFVDVPPGVRDHLAKLIAARTADVGEDRRERYNAKPNFLIAAAVP